jgi:hypothetical protein
MGNVNIKRVVADAFASYIVDKIPALTGKVSATVDGPEKTAPCLAVKILPDEFSFESAQQDEVYEADEDDGKLVLDVGSFNGLYTIQLFAVGQAERELYEQKLLDMFLETEWASGTIFLTTPTLIVNGYTSLYAAEVKLRLDSEDWKEEFAFEAKRYSFLDVYVELPALTARSVGNLTSLQLALADTDAEILSTGDLDLSYRVEAQEDGSTLPATD